MGEDQQQGDRYATLSEADLEAIAVRAAELVFDKIYLEVGKSTFRLALFVLGSLVLASLAWLGVAGKIKIGG